MNPRRPWRPPLMTQEAVRSLYAKGLTQSEIALELRTQQKTICAFMRRIGLKARKAAKRDQRGIKNHMWKGDAVGYAAAHNRLHRLRGMPRKCERCGTTTAQTYQWANQTGRFSDLSDYMRLCRSCHARQDGSGQKLTMEQATELRAKHASGRSQKSLAAEYSLGTSSVCRIVLRRSYVA